jgi:hypothetical protein
VKKTMGNCIATNCGCTDTLGVPGTARNSSSQLYLVALPC